MQFDANALRLDREHKARAWHAWHTAWMSKADRMPRLAELTNRTRPAPAPARKAEAQTWEQQRDITRAFTALYGGTIVPLNQQEQAE